jgi:hypothetical protein
VVNGWSAIGGDCSCCCCHGTQVSVVIGVSRYVAISLDMHGCFACYPGAGVVDCTIGQAMVYSNTPQINHVVGPFISSPCFWLVIDALTVEMQRCVLVTVSR